MAFSRGILPGFEEKSGRLGVPCHIFTRKVLQNRQKSDRI
jgi:hypothetical protein